MDETKAQITELRLEADADAWAAAGFLVEDGGVQVGSVPIRFGERTAWTLAGPRGSDFDGLPTELGEGRAQPEPGPEHPIGAARIDHIVVFSADLERTVATFEGNGIRCRRLRDVGPPESRLRQGFFRFGEVICEVVEVPAERSGPGGAARFWGLTVEVADLDAAAAELGDRVGTVRDAVQPGRRIATIRKEAGLGLPVALISPEPEPPTAADRHPSA